MKNLFYIFVRIISLSCIVLTQSLKLNAQVVTKTTAVLVSGTVCPESVTEYSVSIPTAFQSCSRLWTATNGTIDGINTGATVKVKWTDTPGAKGKITCTFSSCSSSTNDNTAPFLEELILSIKNQGWDTFVNSYSVNFCLPQSFVVTMPEMLVQGTGGFNQPARTEVTYFWKLPPGWKDFVTGDTGEFGRPNRSITIVPTACAEPGVITVKGVLNGSGPFCNDAASSSTANISLNAAPPIVSVVPPQGFNGTTACNTTPVTFTAQIANQGNCSVSSYAWSPGSWSIVSQSGNTITLQPTGSMADATSAITCKVTFGCGGDRTGSFTPTFISPQVLGVSPLCSTSTFSVSNAQGVPVTWSSNNTAIATVNSSGVVSRFRGAKGRVIITAALPCAVPAVTKTIWVGEPYPFLVNGPTLVQPVSYNNYNAQKWSLSTPNFSEQGVAVNDFSWSFPLTQTNAGWNCYSCTGEYISITSGTLSTWVTANVQNVCGSVSNNYEVFVQQENCPPGGCDEPFIVYPNPSSEELMISSSSGDGSNNVSRVTLVDSNGSIVYNNEPSKTMGQLIIPVREFKKGTYYLTVIQNGKAIKKQLVIKH